MTLSSCGCGRCDIMGAHLLQAASDWVHDGDGTRVRHSVALFWAPAAMAMKIHDRRMRASFPAVTQRSSICRAKCIQGWFRLRFYPLFCGSETRNLRIGHVLIFATLVLRHQSNIFFYSFSIPPPPKHHYKTQLQLFTIKYNFISLYLFDSKHAL